MAAISESRSNTATAGATRWYAATCSGLAVCRNVAVGGQVNDGQCLAQCARRVLEGAAQQCEYLAAAGFEPAAGLVQQLGLDVLVESASFFGDESGQGVPFQCLINFVGGRAVVQRGRHELFCGVGDRCRGGESLVRLEDIRECFRDGDAAALDGGAQPLGVGEADEGGVDAHSQLRSPRALQRGL